MDLVECLIVYRDRPGRSREGRDLLAEACNEIIRLRKAGEQASDGINQAIGQVVKKFYDGIEQYAHPEQMDADRKQLTDDIAAAISSVMHHVG
jgi:hypothetical protein